MKYVLTILMAIAMLGTMAMPTPAFADGDDNGDPVNGPGDAEYSAPLPA